MMRQPHLFKLVALAVVCLAARAHCNTFYVASNGPVGGDGNSWTQAFTNLQTAIDTAAANDTIYIAGHTFSNSTAQASSQYLSGPTNR